MNISKKSKNKNIFPLLFTDSNTSPDDDEPPPLSAPESQTVKDNPASTAVSESIEKVTSKVDEVTLTSEKVTSKVEEVTLTSIENNDQKEVEVPLPTSASDDDEFHEASESVSNLLKTIYFTGKFIFKFWQNKY